MRSREFRPVLIEDADGWRTTFSETDKRNLEQASAAGVQRLLDNAGVYAGRIDGYLGRKTRAAIGDFLQSKGLDAETSDADLMDILEQTAIERARNVGLTFCNRTDKRIWSAMARRRGEGWESRGWWLLEAGGCARVIDEPLCSKLVCSPMPKWKPVMAKSAPFCAAATNSASPKRNSPLPGGKRAKKRPIGQACSSPHRRRSIAAWSMNSSNAISGTRLMPADTERGPASLQDRRIWVFDLDNTLYPAECDLFAEIDQRMTDFVSRFFRLPRDEARAVQKRYYAEHGTTLNGLMSMHGMDPDEFLAHVHEIDLSPLPKTPDLADAIQALPGQKFVYTNGSRGHAERVTQYMGLDHVFDGQFAIEDSRLCAETQSSLL